MVRILKFADFVQDFGKAAKPTMNMSIYRDKFECACGQSHWFDQFVDIVCEGSVMKVMVVCPTDSSFLTSLKIKTFMVVKFKGFESLAGTHISSPSEKLALESIRTFVRG